MIVWVYGRIQDAICPVCRKLICNCSTWCHCSMQTLTSWYEKNWYEIDRKADVYYKPSVDILLSNTEWNLRARDLWDEIHSVIFHCPNDKGNIYPANIELINNWFKAIAFKLSCKDCIHHYTAYVSNNPFKWTTIKELMEYTNNLHNMVNARLWKKVFSLDEHVKALATKAKRLWRIKWWDIYSDRWWLNRWGN